MAAFALTIIGSLVAFMASEMHAKWLAIVGLCLAFGSAYVQYREAQPFALAFDESTWALDGEQFRLVIGLTAHRRSQPVAAVYLKNDSGVLEVVSCDVHTDPTGAVVVAAKRRFSGRVIVR